MTHHVLIVDDELHYCDLYKAFLEPLGVHTHIAHNVTGAMACLDQVLPSLIISDVRMPGQSGLELLTLVRDIWPELPFILVTAYADVRDAVAALKLGAVDYLAKPLNLDELVVCVQDVLGLHDAPDMDMPSHVFDDVIAVSPVMRALFQDAWHLAKSDVNVLLTGESGTGKEVLARFIHQHSARADASCVAINCAALPAELITSELFGHERGAFTGAFESRKGHFREAHKGVLFLDEIGDMPLSAQPTFLRALEQRRVTPVGGSEEVEVDFRLIAATNHTLEEDVRAGRFRADLFYRLNVVELHIPPLRERRADILPLARHFLAQSGHQDKRIARATIACLESYAWPGNVRELSNAMERAGVLTRTNVILPDRLPPAIQGACQGSTSSRHASTQQSMLTLQQSELESLHQALKLTDGNRTHAAELLGITRRGLLKKIKRFGIE